MHYSARDLAVWRARRLDIPVVLGSATPSLETLHNAQAGRYIHLQLPQRVGSAQLPRMQVIDMRPLSSQTVLSPQLHQAITHHLGAGGQVLLFRNRRGWAPLLRCHHCGWIATCPRCDARYTLHPGTKLRPHGELVCHHCGNRHPAPQRCTSCQQDTLISVGFGTIRLEDHLQEVFPHIRIARLDRDNIQRKHALETLLGDMASQRVQILVGTQMLAKGHHFPGVSLVGVVDADQGFFSSDFRAGERMAQLLVQVAGRAGRADRAGEVLIQTHLPEHPMLQALITQGYPHYAQLALAERAHAQWPPYTRLALLRAHAHQAEPPLQFLQAAKTTAQMLKPDEISLYGPVPAPMPRRAGRHRAQLLIQSTHFAPLHQLLQEWIPMLAQLTEARQVRWSIDVDPNELF
jgi:primosomal protein N' (replication factor Y)